MNETARKLMKRIDDASFAMDDVILEDADDACTWSWLTERWPWEGEV